MIRFDASPSYWPSKRPGKASAPQCFRNATTATVQRLSGKPRQQRPALDKQVYDSTMFVLGRIPQNGAVHVVPFVAFGTSTLLFMQLPPTYTATRCAQQSWYQGKQPNSVHCGSTNVLSQTGGTRGNVPSRAPSLLCTRGLCLSTRHQHLSSPSGQTEYLELRYAAHATVTTFRAPALSRGARPMPRRNRQPGAQVPGVDTRTVPRHKRQ